MCLFFFSLFSFLHRCHSVCLFIYLSLPTLVPSVHPFTLPINFILTIVSSFSLILLTAFPSYHFESPTILPPAPCLFLNLCFSPPPAPLSHIYSFLPQSLPPTISLSRFLARSLSRSLALPVSRCLAD